MKTLALRLRSPRLARGAPLLVALTLAAAGTACEDPFKLTASRTNVDVSIELWALSGTPPVYPSAFLVPAISVASPDAAGSFDLAFDIDANGSLVVLPVGSVVSPVTGPREIGFIRPTAEYSTILEAPREGWTNDSSLVLAPGDVFLAKVTTRFCQFDIRQVVYAKFRVDSVLVPERRLKLSARVNQNCGFRSLDQGLPEF